MYRVGLVVVLPCRLLVPAVALAAMTNLRVFRVGTRVFGAAVPDLEEGEQGSMSKKYMMASVVALLIFQSLALGSVAVNTYTIGSWMGWGNFLLPQKLRNGSS